MDRSQKWIRDLEAARRRSTLTWVLLVCLAVGLFALIGGTVLDAVGLLAFAAAIFVATNAALAYVGRPKHDPDRVWYRIAVPPGHLTEHGFDIASPSRAGNALAAFDDDGIRFRLGNHTLNYARSDVASVEAIPAQRWPAVGYFRVLTRAGGVAVFRTNYPAPVNARLIGAGWPVRKGAK
jgi:hypothetical protein